MAFKLKGTTQPVLEVSAAMDGVMPGKGATVKVEKKDKKKDKK
jgi:hypothetical protein